MSSNLVVSNVVCLVGSGERVFIYNMWAVIRAGNKAVIRAYIINRVRDDVRKSLDEIVERNDKEDIRERRSEGKGESSKFW